MLRAEEGMDSDEEAGSSDDEGEKENQRPAQRCALFLAHNSPLLSSVHREG